MMRLRIGRRQVLCTFALCLSWSAVMVTTATSYFTVPTPTGPALNAFLSMQFNGFAVLLAVAVVDALRPGAAFAYWPYIAAVIVGVATGTSTFWLVSQGLIGIPSAYVATGVEPWQPFVLRHGSHALLICGLATLAYASGRSAARSLAAVRSAQLDRVRAEGTLLQSRLAAVQARIDPHRLLATLERVEQQYATDPRKADGELRSLIGELRAAIPHIRPLTGNENF